jgi:hypothetical protein
MRSSDQNWISPWEQVEKAITTLVSYAYGYQLREKRRQVKPHVAEKLCPEQREKYQ